LATTLVLLLIFISNQLVRYLQFAAAGEMSSHAIALLLLLQIPPLLSLLLPLSLFLSILLAYGRLYADNEMTVLAACGVGPDKLLSITMKFSLVIFIVVGILSLWITPKVSLYSDQILSGKTSNILEVLLPNRFQSINKGKWIFYVGAASRDKKNFQEIFAAEQPSTSPEIASKPSSEPMAEASTTKSSNQHPLGVVFAKGGYQKAGENKDNSFLVLTNGYRYEGVPGQKDFKIIKYDEYGVKILQAADTWKEDASNLSTAALWKKQSTGDDRAVAELQWRISLPITAIILTLLGSVLCKIKPKQGRYAKILPAAICYIGYAQLIFLCRAWLKKGMLPSFLGMWWVHLLMLALIIFLVSKQISKKAKT
jgi:lipopolysaccharide export system permease protein